MDKQIDKIMKLCDIMILNNTHLIYSVGQIMKKMILKDRYNEIKNIFFEIDVK